MPAVTVTHCGLWSASTAGTFWWGGDVSPDQTFGGGENFEFPAGNVDVDLT